MKVPTYEPRVETRPIATPYANLNFDTGLGEVARGISRLGAGASELGASVRRAQEQAQAQVATKGLADFTDAGTNLLAGNSNPTEGDIASAKAQGLDVPDTRGYLAKTGSDAVASSAQVRQDLDQRRQDIAKSITDPTARKAFLAHSEGLLTQMHARVEEHASQQIQVVRNATIQQSHDAALRALDGWVDDPANPGYTRDQAASDLALGHDAVIRANQPSPEMAQAAVDRWHSEVGAQAIAKAVDQNDWPRAEKLLAQYRPVLGDAAKKLEATIADHRDAAEADKAAQSAVAISLNAEGKPDAGYALEVLQSVPGDKRTDVERRMVPMLHRANQAWEQKVSTYVSRVKTAYFEGGKSIGAANPSDVAWLKHNDPDAWGKLDTMVGRDLKAAEVAARPRATPRHQETREEEQATLAAISDIVRNPDKYRGMTPEVFGTQDGVIGLSEKGFAAASKEFVRAQKEDPAKASEFSRVLSESIRSNPALAANKAKAVMFSARMVELRNSFEANNPGKHPSAAESTAMKKAALDSVTVDTWYGGTKQVPAYTVPMAPASPATPSASAKKVEVVGPKGQRMRADDATFDVWAKGHPGWSRVNP